jgi:hypothetical protein
MLFQPRDLAPFVVLARLGLALLVLTGAVGAAAAGAAFLHHRQAPASLSLNI